MSELPRVDALLPAHDSEEFIGAALDSLAAQTYPNLRVLISDDASDDGTAAVCEAYAATDPRFRVVRRQQRLGWVGNTNALIAEADADFAFFMADDDQVAPTYVERLVAALGGQPGAVLSFSDVEFVNGSLVGVGSHGVYAVLDGVHDPIERAARFLRLDGLGAIPYRGLVRVPALRKLGGLHRHRGGEYGADWIWLLRLCLEGGFVRVPEQLYRKVYRVGSVSRHRHPYVGHAWMTLAAFGAIRRMRLSLRVKARLGWCLVSGNARQFSAMLRRRVRNSSS